METLISIRYREEKKNPEPSGTCSNTQISFSPSLPARDLGSLLVNSTCSINVLECKVNEAAVQMFHNS
jgi:hypothetical protein